MRRGIVKILMAQASALAAGNDFKGATAKSNEAATLLVNGYQAPLPRLGRNQRQRRKLVASNPHLRRKYAK